MKAKGKTKTKNKDSKWLPPKGASAFFEPKGFYPDYTPKCDAWFKDEHPVGYYLLVILGVIALIAPCCLYGMLMNYFVPEGSDWIALGMLGGFICGIGLFNLVAIIIKQYLGHLVTLLSFLIGITLMVVSVIMI